MEGSQQQQEVSAPAKPEPGGIVYQVPIPQTGGSLAIFKAKISGEDVWVINNNEYPPVLGSISGGEENDVSQDQHHCQQEEGENPELRLKKFVDQIQRAETETEETTVGIAKKRPVEKEKKVMKVMKVKKVKKVKKVERMMKVQKVKMGKMKGGGDGDFECNQCDYKTTQKISLDRHLNALHAGTTFVCDEADCGKSYRWEVDLRNHKDSAHGNLTFPCPEPDCDYLGKSRRNLRVHKKSQHSGPLASAICHVCDESFSSRQYLEVHFKSQHEGHREVCSECGKNFATKATLQRHVKETHKEGDVKTKCEFCQKTFTRNFTKERHVRQAHPEVIENP